MTQRFTAKAESALRKGQKAASAFGHTYLGSEHLLLGLAEEHEGVASRILEGGGVSAERVKETIARFTGLGHPSNLGAEDMTPRLQRIIETAGEKAKGGSVGTEHLLLAILTADGCMAKKVLSSLGCDVTLLLDDTNTLLEIGKNEVGKKRKQKGDRSAGFFSEFGRDLTLAAKEGRLDPVLAREREIERVARILARRRKNNPCLVGEPGVGKTAVVEGLALRIASGEIPPPLGNMRIFSLDISSMIAGAKYRGEFEERMRTLLDSLRNDRDTILFIDEIHTIVGAGAAEGAIDAANILKPAMARGEIRVIGATTLREYRRHIEKDAALERRFQEVLVEEPSKEATKEILEGLRERYESHHGLVISEEAIDAAIEYSVRYLPDHYLPDKALDLIDEAASELRLCHGYRAIRHDTKEELLAAKEKEKESAILAQDFERALLLRDEITAIRAEIAKAKQEVTEKTEMTVTADLIARTISERTGIPLGRIDSDEQERLASLESDLSARVIGQEEAVLAVSRAVRRSRMGVRDEHRPVGSFLFVGPTGVGKTELAKALALSFFGSEQALLRFDMSEYMEKHSVSRLIGAPPGCVGYGEGGLLTEAIRRRPYAVVLFDEIEKAHPDILHLLLQILEVGILTDSQGRRTEFRHAILILTSNLGGGAARQQLGFSDTELSLRKREEESAKEALKAHLRPELINRIDEIVFFHPLSEESIQKIAEGVVEETLGRIREAGFTLAVSPAVIKHLGRIGYSPRYGAREVRRAVLHLFEDAFTQAVMEGVVVAGASYEAELSENRIVFSPSALPKKNV